MKDIDMNQVAHLYYHEEKSAFEIAKIFGCAVSVIYDRMKKNGMPRRSYSEAHKVRHSQNGLNIDLAEIVRLYFEEHLTLVEIAKRLGICSDAVRKRLIAAGYERRKRGTSRHPRKPLDSNFTNADLAEMEQLYCEAELSSVEIARRYKCSDVTVRTHLKRLGVRLRTVKEAQVLRRKKEAVRKKGPVGGNSDSRFLSLPPEHVTSERVRRLRTEENLTIDAIAGRCSLSNLEVYTILQEAGGL